MNRQITTKLPYLKNVRQKKRKKQDENFKTEPDIIPETHRGPIQVRIEPEPKNHQTSDGSHHLLLRNNNNRTTGLAVTNATSLKPIDNDIDGSRVLVDIPKISESDEFITSEHPDIR